MDTRGFSACHTSHTTHHTAHTPHHNARHDIPQQHDNNTSRQQRQRETETDRDKERREERREKRFIFSVVVHWPFFVDVVIFWLIPFAPDSLACQTVSSKIHFRFQCSLAGQQFSNICELFILCSFSFQIFFIYFFGYAVTVSKFFRII